MIFFFDIVSYKVIKNVDDADVKPIHIHAGSNIFKSRLNIFPNQQETGRLVLVELLASSEKGFYFIYFFKENVPFIKLFLVTKVDGYGLLCAHVLKLFCLC